MADHSRLDDLRRRVENDPASIAFAQLAEEYRRAGDYQQAVDVCRDGLEIHPGYLSARVTLGRALLELNDLDGSQHELEEVLRHAPENLAAIRGLAEIHHRRGHLPEALSQYKAALAIARNDPDLERTVEELSREVSPQPREEPVNGLTFENLHRELLQAAAAADAKRQEQPEKKEGPAFATSPIPRDEPPATPEPAIADEPMPTPEVAPVPVHPSPSQMTAAARPLQPEPMDVLMAPVSTSTATKYNDAPDATRERAQRTITALEQWLDALNVARTHRCA